MKKLLTILLFSITINVANATDASFTKHQGSNPISKIAPTKENIQARQDARQANRAERQEARKANRQARQEARKTNRQEKIAAFKAKLQDIKQNRKEKRGQLSSFMNRTAR